MTHAIEQFITHPEFEKIFNLVVEKSPLQRKRLEIFISGQDKEYWDFAENLCGMLNHSLLKQQSMQVEAATSYNRMCMEILREQIRFKKTGIYLNSEAEVANEDVYSQPEIMRSYIVGLLLSYLFWPNHYQMWKFFTDHLAFLPDNKTCLEVGAGHGLFTRELLHRFPDLDMTVLDISDSSIKMAKEMLDTFEINPEKVSFILGDYLKTSINKKFDFVVMGEVLEHVNDAPEFMKRTSQIINQNGHVFVSTCVNCPAVDHIYHFHNVDEIRDLLKNAGFIIDDELVLPAEAVSETMWEEEMITINYCAILSIQ